MHLCSRFAFLITSLVIHLSYHVFLILLAGLFQVIISCQDVPSCSVVLKLSQSLPLLCPPAVLVLHNVYIM